MCFGADCESRDESLGLCRFMPLHRALKPNIKASDLDDLVGTAHFEG